MEQHSLQGAEEHPSKKCVLAHISLGLALFGQNADFAAADSRGPGESTQWKARPVKGWDEPWGKDAPPTGTVRTQHQTGEVSSADWTIERTCFGPFSLP